MELITENVTAKILRKQSGILVHSSNFCTTFICSILFSLFKICVELGASVKCAVDKSVSNRTNVANKFSFVDHVTGCWGIHYTFTLLGFLGFASIYAMRVNLSLAIVSMVNHTAFHFVTNQTESDYACPETLKLVNHSTEFQVC